MSEAKFVVGQWVTCGEHIGRVTEIAGNDVCRMECDGCDVWGVCKPFVWQVGKTYRTTLEGVSVRIVDIDSEGDIVGMPWEGNDYRHWRGRTGRLIGHDTDDAKPHILPYLADEPPHVAEAATCNQFSKVQAGDYVRWNGKDYKVSQVDKEDETLLCCSLACGAQPMWIKWSDVESFVLAERKPNDDVNHPSHYTSHPSGVECIAITEHFNFNVGNAVKYLWRAGLKGDALEDLRKAAWYVQREIERAKR